MSPALLGWHHAALCDVGRFGREPHPYFECRACKHVGIVGHVSDENSEGGDEEQEEVVAVVAAAAAVVVVARVASSKY